MTENTRIQTSDHRRARSLWVTAGGTIESVWRTGEIRYRHPFFAKALTINGRRADAPAVVVNHLNKLARAGFWQTNNKGTKMKTSYAINDEHGHKTTITISKWDADVLQAVLPDVHAWVQDKYERVAKEYPELKRLAKGDIVRRLASREAGKHPERQTKLLDLL